MYKVRATIFISKIIELAPIVVDDLESSNNKVMRSENYTIDNINAKPTILAVSKPLYTNTPMELDYKKMFPEYYV